MTAPTCSVVIPSYQSAPTLGACLASLAAQDFTAPYEVIVVDSSPNQSAAMVAQAFAGVRVQHYSQQTDPARARNVGARQAGGAILAFLDADCVAPAHWLRRLYAGLQAGCDGLGGAIGNGNVGSNDVAWAGYLCEFREFLPIGKPRAVTNLTLGNAAYRREAFWDIGGFPVGFFPQEDQVFHQAFCARGCTLRFDPGLVVCHTHRSERRAFLAHQQAIGRVNARVVRQLSLPGSTLARRPALARLALPALLLYRWARTVLAGLRVERALLVRRPRVAWLCWLGMWAWGRGFLEGAGGMSHGSAAPAWDA